MTTESRQRGYKFLLGWIGASALGGLAAATVGMSVLVLQGLPPVAVVRFAAAGLLLGAALGSAQWLVLRSQLHRAGWWILATIAGMTVGYSVAEPLVAQGVSTATLALDGALLGLAVGTAQWFVLRRSVPTSIWWIPASAIAAALGHGVLGLAVAYVPPIVRPAMTWAIVSVVTGAVLLRSTALRWGVPLGAAGLSFAMIFADDVDTVPGPDEEICGTCRPDPMSPTGARQFCRFGPAQTGWVPCLPDGDRPDPLPPVEGDDDGDGIVDYYEDQLLNRFAPVIWLHFDENRGPANVDWLLAQSRLRYGHIRCSDHQLLARGLVNSDNVTERMHRNARDPLTNWPWNWCEHHGPDNRSDSYTGSTKTSFFLQFTDSSHAGLANPRDWILYGHVYPVGLDRISIQYWQLYAFNDSFGSANHEGDWEFTGVLVDRDENPQRVVFYRHGRPVDVDPSRVEWDGDHHVTYVAKGGHAQYRGFVQNFECLGDSLVDDLQGFADKCAPGIQWRAWESEFGGIVNVGERFRPLNNSNWIRFSGLWGEIGFAADAISFTSGPRGPAYQTGNWTWSDE